ncbi:membrane protein, putative [Mycoplasma capricolum subsp. capricolum ATCC 27343]|uniref:Membrane protein, putative n=1 Tax=Mycoplasma capricolum subsp. capricolum (strain California kid / ATCC 27343 / NCTC 10154) TaxID=340047 RepID=Q2SSD2_MYCCT|nr:putative immunoglobulin-blocking virulence protein [Mycoplasma capricolum]ABC01364.1 membrane protein, putative [Mycoplasma capricolum subsp. capricolum ATCC 27343]
MYFLKKKKNKILMYTLVASLATSLSFGSVIYYSISDANISFETSSNGITDAELTPINNPIDDAIVSNRDNKLKPNPERIIRETNKKDQDKLIIPKKEEKEIKEVAKPEPKPEIIKPETTINKPSRAKVKSQIVINGVTVNAEIEAPPGFIVHDQDKSRNIANPTRPYQNHIVEKILSIEVTQALRDSVVKNSLTGGEGYDKGAGLFQNTLTNVISREIEENKGNIHKALENLEAISKQNSDFFNSSIERYKRLLDSKNVIEYLKPEAKIQYPKLKGEFKTKTQEYLWLINNLDHSKFTKIASTSEKYLKEGLTISPRSAFINENGEIDSHGWGPPDAYNTVTSRLQRDNSTYRVFDYDQYYNRSSDRIENGTYPGWTKKDVTNDFTSSFGFSKSDGITISRLTRDNKTNVEGKINSGLVLELDVSNTKAYEKSKELIEKFKSHSEKITSYRIKNMGEISSDQKFIEILSALPEDIPQLELFFSDKATNTASLIALENKKIKELSLYTNGNSLRNSWSYNPLALRNTTWINTIDYNVSAQYSSHQKITTRITFNTLAFDQKDFENNSYQRINDGLRMVYYARNNEPFFQGAFGPGLSPDRSLGDNSYPTGLDFSRVTGIKSLKGLRFDDEYNPSNKPRKIAELTLFNDNSHFEISADELNDANLEHLSTGENSPIKPKIKFSNGNATTKIRITGNNITEKGRQNLEKYFDYSDSLKVGNKQIEVTDTSGQLANKLKDWGYNVTQASDKQFT